MDTTDFRDIIKTNSDAILSNNEDFYNNVFKKTERVISAMLYILSYIEDNKRQGQVVTRVEDSLFKVHDSTLMSLTKKETEAKETLLVLQQHLVSLMSNLHLVLAARLIPQEVMSGIEEELDAVMRYIRNHYLGTPERTLMSRPQTSDTTTPRRIGESKPRRQRPNIPLNDLSSDAVLVYSDLNDRSVRIKTVLEATPNATIKDLSDVITDVSSKTIQRELNSLIEKGEVARQGERRWSTYNIIK